MNNDRNEPNRRVLLVDDEVGILNALERNLRSCCQIKKASCGEDAIAFLIREPYAVIICDQKMPGMDGNQVLKKAKELSPDTIRITLTAYTDPTAMMTAINEGGVSRFLMKPWDSKQIVEEVESALRHYNLIHENERLDALVKKQNMELKSLNEGLEEEVRRKTASLVKAGTALKQTLDGLVVTFSDILEAYSSGLRGHSKRVSELSGILAGALGMSEDFVQTVKKAGLLHDLGMVSVRRELIGMDLERLDKKERESLMRHAEIGFSLLKDIPNFREVSDIVLRHHEYYNGKGYPDGKKKEQIPLGAKIVAVVNVFDCELYPLGEDDLGTVKNARDAVRKSSGTVLDPKLVDVFVSEVLEKSSFFEEREVECLLAKLKEGMVLSRDVTNLRGVVLLKKGTELTHALISRLSSNEDFDPMISGIFVERTSVPTLLKDANSFENNKKDDKTGTVLVVDDEPSVINAIRRELRSAGIHVDGLANPIDALKRLKSENVSVLISDYNMPGLKGDQFLERVQKTHPNLPCVIITGHATRENVTKMMKVAKIHRVLNKPWNREQLVSIVKELLDAS